MSPAAPKESSYTCVGCGMSVSWSDGARNPMPAGWAREKQGDVCLKCRREQAADAAGEAVGSDREARAKLRKEGLIEFEIRRAPERPNNLIAKACHSSPIAIAAARKRIEAETASS